MCKPWAGEIFLPMVYFVGQIWANTLGNFGGMGLTFDDALLLSESFFLSVNGWRLCGVRWFGRLKIPWAQARAGSTPVPSIIETQRALFLKQQQALVPH